MKVVLFVHSLVSDWNHGNAHFLRGVATELQSRGHEVVVYEPERGWSLENLKRSQGEAAVQRFATRFPHLRSIFYDAASIDLDAAVGDADLVLVHEWNEPHLVSKLGRHRRQHAYRLLFHDTHHRAVTRPETMRRYDLSEYDGALAFGKVIADVYLERGWASRAWTWHEAADVRTFRPLPAGAEHDVVWIGNWGDGERSAELDTYLLGPAAALDLTGTIHGVRYPKEAVEAISQTRLQFRKWVANFDVPEVFARHRMTVHIPRRPYARRMTGIPTIRMFEALACGIPLVSAPWEDSENLFRAGQDYLVAHSGQEMEQHLKELLNDADLAASLVDSAQETIHSRHTCAHRVAELLAIYEELS